ncbi:dihydrofolate reductase family protein [Nonomuraea mangrovi]|uniref:Dihydrofolate reductase family protein n=1 Tax=Nonomuraea mangrovi TaxID=2316207 RepID=A0ABW4SWU9_9ACTN
MSKVVVVIVVSMDGVVEEPTWAGPFWNDEHARFHSGHLFASRALLLGRRTFDSLSKMWPAMARESDFAARMDSIPKYVASTTLRRAGWNAVVIKGDVAEQVTKLKREPGRDLLVYGSADLVNYLIKHGLVDELKLLVHPVVVGPGKRLFPDGVDSTTWTLAATSTFGSGTIVLEYRPAAGQRLI